MSITAFDQAFAARAQALLEELTAQPPQATPRVLTRAQLAGMIDHTLLKPDAVPSQLETLCAEARAYRFASVCVNPVNVALCARALAGSGVPVCSVVGFPLGASRGDVKAFEAAKAVGDGASEIDMVINVGALKTGLYAIVRDDIAAVAAACHQQGAHLKVIIEACLLRPLDKVAACLLCLEAGADYVKTSTGLSTGGATVEDVALMRALVGPSKGVKAAGGIRTYETAMAMVAAGASRIGASAGIQIIADAPESL